MAGGLMQLVAYGAQDLYLTGNPQITFFKVVYRRHTNFSIEATLQSFNGTIDNEICHVSSILSKNGDLVTKLWLDVKLDRTGAIGTQYWNWCNNTGHSLIKECEIEIGSQRIDKHYSQWLDIQNELKDHSEIEWAGLNKHKAKEAYLRSGPPESTSQVTKLYVPLHFWFCDNPGLALPLIALQYHDVNVNFVFRDIHNLINTVETSIAPATTNITDPTNTRTIQLWADYVYLDTDERRRFAQVSHEYLIEQIQREKGAMATSFTLNFNHPVKELIWVNQVDVVAQEEALTGKQDVDATQNLDGKGAHPMVGSVLTARDSSSWMKHDYFNYGSRQQLNTEYINGQKSYEAFKTATLQLNGHDRISVRDATYYRICQPIQNAHKLPTKHIYCYSFSLIPEEHQPSGTCNFSKIDAAELVFTKDAARDYTGETLSVYAINYNVLRIVSGMGGLAYTN